MTLVPEKRPGYVVMTSDASDVNQYIHLSSASSYSIIKLLYVPPSLYSGLGSDTKRMVIDYIK